MAQFDIRVIRFKNIVLYATIRDLLNGTLPYAADLIDCEIKGTDDVFSFTFKPHLPEGRIALPILTSFDRNTNDNQLCATEHKSLLVVRMPKKSGDTEASRNASVKILWHVLEAGEIPCYSV